MWPPGRFTSSIFSNRLSSLRSKPWGWRGIVFSKPTLGPPFAMDRIGRRTIPRCPIFPIDPYPAAEFLCVGARSAVPSLGGAIPVVRGRVWAEQAPPLQSAPGGSRTAQSSSHYIEDALVEQFLRIRLSACPHSSIRAKVLVSDGDLSTSFVVVCDNLTSGAGRLMRPGRTRMPLSNQFRFENARRDLIGIAATIE